MMTLKSSSYLWNRRTWLRAASGLISASAFSAATSNGLAREFVSQDRPGWIDAHVHVWPKLTTDYPLAKDFGPELVKPPSFTPESLLQVCRPCGVDRVVLIQMNFFGFDNSYMLDTIAAHPGVFSGVAVIDHEQSDLQVAMQRMREKGVRGYRLYATSENVKAWQSSRSIEAMFRNGADLGQAMCMLSDPESLEGIESLCSRHPQTTVVIDHFSRIGMRSTPTQEQLQALGRLARFPKVYVKTSAFYALGRKEPPYTDLIPLIRRLLETFGSDRLMWASDCPYQVEAPHTYEASIALMRDRLDSITDLDRQNLLRKTAERVFF